jgi:hypothetical protein
MQKHDRDDRLSSLPDDILVNILDRLNARDASRTSVLSRRWSQLLVKLSRLIINAKDFLPEGLSNDNMSGDDLVRVNAAAVEATKSLLACRNPGEHTIRLLSTAFYLRDDVPISIGHAVGNAMATHKVEKAEFTVLTEKQHLQCTLDDTVNYGAQFVSFFNECLNAFSGLTRLYLENLTFAESDMVSNILVACKQLKYLGFLNCETESWMTLQVEHEQLSELSFVDCCFGKVELKWLPRLSRVNFVIWRVYKDLPLSFGHVPLLEAVTLVNVALSWHKMVKLSTLLSETSVQELHLGFKCEKVIIWDDLLCSGFPWFSTYHPITCLLLLMQIWVQPERLTKRQASAFQRLRIVNLDCIPEGYDLTWTMFILEAAPSLEEFYMTVCPHQKLDVWFFV